jgi:hypothetical protein
MCPATHPAGSGGGGGPGGGGGGGEGAGAVQFCCLPGRTPVMVPMCGIGQARRAPLSALESHQQSVSEGLDEWDASKRERLYSTTVDSSTGRQTYTSLLHGLRGVLHWTHHRGVSPASTARVETNTHPAHSVTFPHAAGITATGQNQPKGVMSNGRLRRGLPMQAAIPALSVVPAGSFTPSPLRSLDWISVLLQLRWFLNCQVQAGGGGALCHKHYVRVNPW